MSIYPSELLLEKYAPITPIPHCEEIKAHIAPDFFDLWENYEKEQKHITEIPYWAAVWPGAKSLAFYILQNPEIVREKSVLDFGCGSGAVSIAAIKAGAKNVIANDIDLIALHIANLNALANKVTLKTSNHNFLNNETNDFYDLIIVSDMFYERSTAKPLQTFLKKAIANGSRVLIADGTRPFTPRKDLHQILTEIIPVNKPLEGMSERRVHLFWMD